MFVALFLLYGIAMPPLTTVLENRLPQVNPKRPLTSVAPYLVLIGMGSVMLLPFVLVFFDEEFCGCEPNYLTGVFVVGLAFATMALWLVRLLVGGQPTRLMMVGYAALVGATLSGAFRAWSDIADILDGGL